MTVSADKTEKVINAGRQISIDASNTIKESIYISSKIYAIMAGVLAFVLGVVLVIYRKTKVGSTLIKILKTIAKLLWGLLTFIVIWLGKGLRLAWQFLASTINKVSKKKKQTAS